MDQASKLRRIRTEQKLTCLDIAKLCGVTESAVRHWENGIRKIPILAQRTICKAYDVRRKWWDHDEEPAFYNPARLAAARKAITVAADAGRMSDLEGKDEPENAEFEKWLLKVRARVPQGKNSAFYKTLGLSGNQTYNNWEKGRNTIPAWAILRIIRQFAIAEDLLWWANLPTPSQPKAPELQDQIAELKKQGEQLMAEIERLTNEQ